MKAARMRVLSRRQFLGAAAAAPLTRYHELAAAERKRVKIRDVQTMTLQGSSRTYVLVRIVSDDGLHGIGEAYGTPGVGVSEQILSLKPWLVGKDPLEIDTLYTELGVGTKDLWHSHGWFRAQLDSSPSRKG
jgi:L-alanine-DL-glutamate epimerase-like enolase superfamily enzyme